MLLRCPAGVEGKDHIVVNSIPPELDSIRVQKSGYESMTTVYEVKSLVLNIKFRKY